MKTKPLAFILLLIFCVSCTGLELVRPNPIDPCDFANMSFSPNEMRVGEDIIQGFTFTPEGEQNCTIAAMPVITGGDANNLSSEVIIQPGQQPLNTDTLLVAKGMVFLFSIRWIDPCLPPSGFPTLYLTSTNGSKMALPSPTTSVSACGAPNHNLTVEVNGFMYPP